MQLKWFNELILQYSSSTYILLVIYFYSLILFTMFDYLYLPIRIERICPIKNCEFDDSRIDLDGICKYLK